MTATALDMLRRRVREDRTRTPVLVVAPLDVVATWPEHHRMGFEERAAILEYEGGFSRTEAEKRAFDAVNDETEGEGRT